MLFVTGEEYDRNTRKRMTFSSIDKNVILFGMEQEYFVCVVTTKYLKKRGD